METLFSLMYLLVPLILGLTLPSMLIYYCLAVGFLPLYFAAGNVGTPFGALDSSAIRLLGVLIASSVCVLLRLDQAWPYVKRYACHAVFLLLACTGALWAPSLSFSARMIAKLSAPFVFLLFVLVTVHEPRQLMKMERMILFSGLLSVAIVVLLRLSGLGNPTELSLPDVSAAVFSAHLLAVSALALSRAVCQPGVKNIVIWLLLAGALVAAFVRITIGALFLTSALIIALPAPTLIRYLLPPLGISTLVSLFLLNESFKKRMFFSPQKIDFSAVIADPSLLLDHINGSGRFAMWKKVVDEFFLENPILGSGIGSTQDLFYTQTSIGHGAIHSEYIRLLAELGIIGFVVFMVTLMYYFMTAARNLMHRSNMIDMKYSLAAMGGLFGYFVFMATDNAFDYVSSFGLYVFALVAMSEKASELSRRQVAGLDLTSISLG